MKLHVLVVPLQAFHFHDENSLSSFAVILHEMLDNGGKYMYYHMAHTISIESTQAMANFTNFCYYFWCTTREVQNQYL